jgi:tetratricopeptide (TPR) repeat protein
LSSTQHLAEIYVAQGFYSEAYEILKPYQKQWDGPTLFLMQWVCYKREDFEQAVKIGVEVFKQKPDYQTAFLNAQCNALIGDRNAALGWLKCSIREGLPHVSENLNHKDFDSLRNDSAFQNLYLTL